MKSVLLTSVLIALSACTQQPQQQVQNRDYFVTSENPYEGQPGVPQRLDGDTFRNQVRQKNGTVSSGNQGYYEDRAMRSSINVMQTFSRAVAGGN